MVEKMDHHHRKVFVPESSYPPTQTLQYNALGQLVQASGREQVNVPNGGETFVFPGHWVTFWRRESDSATYRAIRLRQGW